MAILSSTTACAAITPYTAPGSVPNVATCVIDSGRDLEFTKPLGSLFSGFTEKLQSLGYHRGEIEGRTRTGMFPLGTEKRLKKPNSRRIFLFLGGTNTKILRISLPTHNFLLCFFFHFIKHLNINFLFKKKKNAVGNTFKYFKANFKGEKYC